MAQLECELMLQVKLTFDGVPIDRYEGETLAEAIERVQQSLVVDYAEPGYVIRALGGGLDKVEILDWGFTKEKVHGNE